MTDAYILKPKTWRAKMEPMLASNPLEQVHMDFLTIKLGNSNKDINILATMNHSTRYAKTYVTSSQTVTTLTKKPS